MPEPGTIWAGIMYLSLGVLTGSILIIFTDIFSRQIAVFRLILGQKIGGRELRDAEDRERSRAYEVGMASERRKSEPSILTNFRSIESPPGVIIGYIDPEYLWLVEKFNEFNTAQWQDSISDKHLVLEEAFIDDPIERQRHANIPAVRSRRGPSPEPLPASD